MTDPQNTLLMDDICSKKAVIFDLDGTLVDSMWMWYNIDVEFLGRYGLPCPPDLQRSIQGMSFSETADYFKDRFSLPESTDEIKAVWEEMSFDKYKNDVPLRKGAREFLIFLKDRGIKTGVATSNGEKMVEAVLASNKVDSYFDCVKTSDDVPRGKPAPDIYQSVAKDLGVGPDECMVFEDVPAGIQAAKAAGMKVCAVEDEDAAPYRDEIKKLSDYYIHDYTDMGF